MESRTCLLVGVWCWKLCGALHACLSQHGCKMQPKQNGGRLHPPFSDIATRVNVKAMKFRSYISAGHLSGIVPNMFVLHSANIWF